MEFQFTFLRRILLNLYSPWCAPQHLSIFLVISLFIYWFLAFKYSEWIFFGLVIGHRVLSDTSLWLSAFLPQCVITSLNLKQVDLLLYIVTRLVTVIFIFCNVTYNLISWVFTGTYPCYTTSEGSCYCYAGVHTVGVIIFLLTT